MFSKPELCVMMKQIESNCPSELNVRHMHRALKMNIKEIAYLAGVSVATVSRVINNSDSVKPATRERVQKVMQENNYIPSATARDLSFQRSEVVAVVVPDLKNPFFYGLIEGITRVAEKNHYQVLIFNTNEDADKEYQVLPAIRERNVAGILITAAGVRDKRTGALLAEYQQSGTPVVLVDRFIEGGDGLDTVMADNESGSYEAICELIRQGHERIAIIAGEKTLSPVYERELGYRRALSENGIKIREMYIAYGNQMADKSYSCMKKLMSLSKPPTAVFCGNNLMSLGALRYLIENGMAAGEDVAIIGFDDIDVLNHVGIPLSVVDRSEKEMGRKAMEILLRHLKKMDTTSTHISVPTRLILRGSEKARNVKPK